ncbi:hypothetical protein HNR06_002314 [Nocardiopsis arvandica]|uniref:DUF3566 domain-containing protein n=1 Tax=Nocardiopsis sinuspersici TaxID=501010 RepID=A0A7Z0BK34_9ACTN|nr:DUF3566 domain-containing protein [Nocardiopsis sinuspersici]NYH52725.1 hypothetical protein [Nocardiopsis sinuspersici]
MSDNQRNTTTNESDPDTAGAVGSGDVETAEKDTVEAGATVTTEVDDASDQKGTTEAEKASTESEKDSGGAGQASGEESTTESAKASTESGRAATGSEKDLGGAEKDSTGSGKDSDEAGKAATGSEKGSGKAAKASSGSGKGFGKVVKAFGGSGKDSGGESVADEADKKSSVPVGSAVAEDRAEAGGTPVSESKSAVPESSSGPSAVKASLSSRKAHLTVSRVEPWSVMKFSFVVSLVCFIILFVAVAVIYATLSMLGVFDQLTSMMNALLEGDGSEDELGLNPAAWFSPGRVLGYTGVVGALNIVLITALSTVGAMLYNLVADLVGGVDVTLSEAE